ncbi:cysteine desulfhydrase [Marinomonas agarivorans]|nr:cysteine desulfhydrase [Marinomonas agarivorans]
MIQPLHPILTPETYHKSGVKLYIYRGDLEHVNAPGNKWHKLKHNLAQAKQQGAKHIISFGGPYSNHLHALGNVCQQLNITPVAIIRGELQPQLTPTLRDFIKCGGILWPSRRDEYRLGMQSSLVAAVSECYERGYWVPEGGSNSQGVNGCYDWAKTISTMAEQQGLNFDAWAVSAGTGATSAGFLACSTTPDIMVFPALKGGGRLSDEIKRMALSQNQQTNLAKLQVFDQYHCGGYAKLPPVLQNYIKTIHILNSNLKLDPIYTAKVVYGLEQEIQSGTLTNKRILIVHTGGLQGWRGFNM